MLSKLIERDGNLFLKSTEKKKTNAMKWNQSNWKRFSNMREDRWNSIFDDGITKFFKCLNGDRISRESKTTFQIGNHLSVKKDRSFVK